MTPYILAAIGVALLALMWTWYDLYGFWETLLGVAFLTAIGFWPVGWVFDRMADGLAASQQATAARDANWLSGMTSRGCKRTSFVGTRSRITAVWTCPDGTAVLDPR